MREEQTAVAYEVRHVIAPALRDGTGTERSGATFKGFLHPTVQAIGRQAAIVSGVHIADIMSAARERDIVKARHMAMFMAREYGHHFSKIARAFSKDHTTVLSGVRRVNKYADSDPDLRRWLIIMRQRCAALKMQDSEGIGEEPKLASIEGIARAAAYVKGVGYEGIMTSQRGRSNGPEVRARKLAIFIARRAGYDRAILAENFGIGREAVDKARQGVAQQLAAGNHFARDEVARIEGMLTGRRPTQPRPVAVPILVRKPIQPERGEALSSAVRAALRAAADLEQAADDAEVDARRLVGTPAEAYRMEHAAKELRKLSHGASDIAAQAKAFCR